MNASHTFVFATRNQYKVDEIMQVAGPGIRIIPMSEAGCNDDLPETSFTTAGNATQKAQYFYDRFQQDCFADDTSLEIDALEGRPGVHSARFAGLSKSFEENVNKVLSEMEGKANRKAVFRTVICLIHQGKHYLFEGLVEGTILTERRGNGGFGYDPIFLPKGWDKTYAQMDMAEKNKMSHRGLAFKKLADFLGTL